MLRYTLTHRPTLSALASLGHGSRVLVADGNYPFATAMHPRAELVHLNWRPGVLDVDEVLTTLLDAVPFEAATVMTAPPDAPVAAHDGYRRILGPDVPFGSLDRFAFLRRRPGAGDRARHRHGRTAVTRELAARGRLRRERLTPSADREAPPSYEVPVGGQRRHRPIPPSEKFAPARDNPAAV
ncbi:RbsD/FucU family protein, partial [Curtobacterium sp. B8]|uniref:RbsD/FucU family protein n=1 Tax=Curtobacterium sp. B8 TaxID=95611 RepID=UPI0021C675D6